MNFTRSISRPTCPQCGNEIPSGEPAVKLHGTIRFVTAPAGNSDLMCSHIVRLDCNPHKPDQKAWLLIWHPECFGSWMIERCAQAKSCHHHEVDYHVNPPY